MTIEYDNINDAFLDSLKMIRNHGDCDWLQIRGSRVKEIVDHSFVIKNPTRRVLTCRKRYNNILATVAETLWVLSGRNDMNYLTQFLPNATDYADGKKTFWGGGYANRLRHYNVNLNRSFHGEDEEINYSFYDQISNVIKTLSGDRYSRQAIIVIPQPDVDYNIEIKTKDRPCTIFVQFLIRNDKLHCFVKMRSNDCIWGSFNINVFEWTVLQEIIANILAVDIGEYHHNAVSFHYYENMKNRVENILGCEQFNIYDEFTKCFVKSPKNSFYDLYDKRMLREKLSNLYDNVDSAMKLIKECGRKKISKEEMSEKLSEIDLPQWLVRLPIAQILINHERFETAFDMLNSQMCDDDGLSFDYPYYVAGLEYLFRLLRKNKQEDLISKLKKKLTRVPPMSLRFIMDMWD